MTTEAPEHLYGLSPVNPEDALTRAVNRLAQAIEQNTMALTLLDRPTPTAPPALAALPPVQAVSVNPVNAGCPVHRQPWKLVPAGISKKNNKPYDAFWACPERGCDQRPA